MTNENTIHSLRQGVYDAFLRQDSNAPFIPPLTISSIVEETEEARPSDEEWVWVTGYKGTDKNMQCRDYQFEMGKQFDMPEGAAIIECRSGFHLCLKLEDVFAYYGVGSGNRFFEVRALVLKSAVDDYGSYSSYRRSDKLAAKSIEFIRELTANEILGGKPFYSRYGVNVDGWTEEDKFLALEKSVSYAQENRNRAELLFMGYSERMVEYFAMNSMTNLALTLGSQEGLSMDTKIRILFNTNND